VLLNPLPFLKRPSRPPGSAIGLIACAGRFPVVVAEKARDVGVPIVCVGLTGMADPTLEKICTEFHWLSRLSLGFVSRKFQAGGVKRWTMAGKFHKRILFQPWRWLQLCPDWRLLKLWFNRRRTDNADDNLLLAIIDEFRRDGLDCYSALELCPELLVSPGVLTRRAPSAQEDHDIRYGWTLARQMGALDIGQSVMIRDRAVLAVEAIEGTDQAIMRAGDLCGHSAFVVVKVAKPDQDMRFDVPTVGPTTIESMKTAGAKTLAIEAGKTIVIDERETIDRANRYGMTIVAKSDAEMQSTK
jgi:UDP-2,3-diacylglucosamine hydrolase